MRKDRFKIVILSFLAGILAVLADTALDVHILEEGKTFLESLIFHPDRREIYIRSLILINFTIFGFILSITLTKKREAEDAYIKSEDKYKTLVENAKDVIFDISTDGKIRSLNSAFEENTGWKVDEWVGKDFTGLLHPSSIDVAMEAFEISSRGEPPPLIEISILAKSGNHIGFEITGKPIITGGKVKGVLGIARDITERKKDEDEALRAQKLESLGTMAGGIAHDFNNLLTSILGNIGVARTKVIADERVQKRLLEAEKAGLRSKDLVNQLLTFSSGGVPVKKPTFIGSIIKESSEFALRGSNVVCTFSIPRDLWPVDVDESQLSQVISNIVINADQSMPDGGSIFISCKNIEKGNPGKFPFTGDSCAAKCVMISVRDRGVGISEDHLIKIFDPYFTTKQKGSGLGLATAYSILKNHNGVIDVESDAGTGTTFRICLPASEKMPDVGSVTDEVINRGEGRVLVMDDEEGVRSALSEMLATIGYEVELANNGNEAIDAYKSAMESGRPFDAVIMDLTVPGEMGGKEAAANILKLDPHAKTIVSSGYSHDPVMSEYGKYGFSGVLPKPYRILELGQVVGSVINSGSRD